MKHDDSGWFHHAINIYGQTPLHLARSVQCIETLYSAGYDINISDSYGNTLLHAIVTRSNYRFSGYEQIKLLKYVLEMEGCNVNQRNENCDTALHAAVKCGDWEVVELFLLSPRCEAMALDEDKNSILHLAVKTENIPMIKYLLSSEKVDVECINENGDTAVHLAAARASKDMISCFSSHMSINCYDKKGLCPIHIVACMGDLELLRHVVDTASPDLSLVTREGDTILHLVCEHCDVAAVSYILNLGIFHIDTRNGSMDTCLHNAIRSSRLDVTEFLLNCEGIDLHGTNAYGLTLAQDVLTGPFAINATNVDRIARLVTAGYR